MPQPKGDLVFFVIHQRQDEPTEIAAHLVRKNELEDLKTAMTESGYKLCESTAEEPFKAMAGEAFYIRLVGDLIVSTLGQPSYRQDRIKFQWLPARGRRRDFFAEGVYRGRFQAEYAGHVLLHRITVHAANNNNKGDGKEVALGDHESILGDVVSSSKLIIPKDRDDPAPPEVQESFTKENIVKDIVLRTISKDIPKTSLVALAMCLLGLSEGEILNLSVLPHYRDFDEQRYAVLEKWMLTAGGEATFSNLVAAFRAVKMTSAANNLDRNLLTNQRLKSVARGLPGDLQPLADAFRINLEESRQNYADELADHKFQILYRWREDSFETVRKRASHTKLLGAMRKCGMELPAEKCSLISSADTRDDVLLHIVSNNANLNTMHCLACQLGLTEEEIDGLMRDHGRVFNKKLFLLNVLASWLRHMEKKGEGARFEILICEMEKLGLKLNAEILNEELVMDKRLRFAASQIANDKIQPLADQLGVDTAAMMIQYGGEIGAELGYRLLVRWKESRGKHASHTELMKAMESAGLGALGHDVDKMGSVNISKGAMCDFCLHYVASWIHVSRASYEWPSLVQTIPSDLTEGLDQRTVDLIKRQFRDPREQLACALALCRDRCFFKSAGAFVNRLVACGFEKTALMLLDMSRSQYYCSTLRLDEDE